MQPPVGFDGRGIESQLRHRYQRNSLYLMSMGRTSESVAEMNRAHDWIPFPLA